MNKYDVIVIGGGHAGIEASYSAAKMGCKVLLLTIQIDDIGKLSCNPAVGGVSKGHLVREVDALGGLIGRITDSVAVGYRTLNRSKGKAVWATRAQVDRLLYPKVARGFLENEKNIMILQGKVRRLLVKNKKIYGVETNFGQEFLAKAVIICAGTFLKSTIHIGLNSFSGGRLYEESSDELFASIKKLGFITKHFKTGTCARLDKRTIDLSAMTIQPAEGDVQPFSIFTQQLSAQRMSCYITHTNHKTHKIILDNLKQSPLYTGKIKATGVRYCPSLEDKVVRFKERTSHHVFIEPEGTDTVEVYPNGVSTSLPFDVQVKFIHTIKGLEKAVILKPGYGIEHGVVETRELDHTLESKKIGGLYFAGQINGTTGYEEAAAQGIIAGINAGLKVKNKKSFILSRQEAFIGVLIDDLVTKGTDEPYRMFTSRSEFRLAVRESNSDLRLVPYAVKMKLLTKQEEERIREKQGLIDKQIKKLQSVKVVINNKTINLYAYLKQPNISYEQVEQYLDDKISDLGMQSEVEICVKYEGFLKREKIWLKELKNIDKIKIPKIDYSSLHSLSREIKEKLEKFQPTTLAQALNISGVTPAAVLHIYNVIKKQRFIKK